MGTSKKIGIVLLDMGEPPEYNEHTYYSFRDYAEALVNIGVVKKEFLNMDKGTILMDRKKVFPEHESDSRQLINAWLRPYKGKASTIRKVSMPSEILSEKTKSYYVQRNGGRGKGEPDFYEMYGFDICRRWQLMGGSSPYHHQTLLIKENVKALLEKKFKGKILVKFAYGMDPLPDQEKQTPDVVIRSLLKKEISHLLVAEHSNVFSDVTSTFYLRKKVSDALKKAKSKIPVSYANQLGENEALNMGLAAKVSDELRILPERSKVMIALSNHGLPPAVVGEYDAGKDAYHENVKRVFEKAKAMISKIVKKKKQYEVVQVFARQTEALHLSNSRILTPKRALDMAVSRGFNYYIDIPYEMPADGVHVLVKLRQFYGIDPPKWNRLFETNFPYKSLKAKITSAYFYPEYRTRAYYLEILSVLENLLT